jgi:lipopolysaccharide/colanic/teichoic acid biosynthesis glycosyltransferase
MSKNFSQSGGKLTLPRNDFKREASNVAKRLFDIAIALAMILMALPLMFIVAALIMAKDPGKVFFVHRRVGRDGKEFGCLKFRTMVNGAEEKLAAILEANPDMMEQWEKNQKLADDPRIIEGVGQFLRKSSLDELPQLFNILLGHMSFVGPRPVTRAELVHYGSLVEYYLAVKPGLTGPWQIGGRSDVTFEKRVQMDVEYAANANFATDIKLFVKTVRAFATGKLSGAA